MRPAVHGNGSDVSRRVKTAGAKRAAELLANVALDGFKRSHKQLNPAHAVLVARGQSRFARSFHHVNYDRLLGGSGAAIVADADWQIQAKVAVITTRRIDR